MTAPRPRAPSWAAGALILALVLPLGVVLGWVFERRGTLAVPIALHAAFNAATVAIMVAATQAGILAT